MKITRPSLGYDTPVHTTTAVMSQTLACLAGFFNGVPPTLHSARVPKPYPYECWLFRSGAKLIHKGPTSFTIRGYANSGSDTLAAIEELKLGDALRIAKRAHNNMVRIMRTQPLDGKMPMFSARQTWGWPQPGDFE